MTCQNQTLYFSLRKFLLGEENSHLTLREEIPIHILRPCFLNPLRFKHCLLKLSYKRTIHLQYDHSSLITAEEQSPKKNLQRKNNSRHIFLDFPPTQQLFKLLLVIKKNLLPKWNHKTLSKIFNNRFFKNQKQFHHVCGSFLYGEGLEQKKAKGKHMGES